MEEPGLLGHFNDPETEQRYIQQARRFRLPMVRLYAVVFMIALLTYSIVNPLYIEASQNARLAVLLGFALLTSGVYLALTFWPAYARYPLIDFVALLIISLTVGRMNVILYEHLNNIDATVYAVRGLNRLIITAFAAVTLAGKPRLFLLWLLFDLLGWFGQILAGSSPGTALVYAALSYFSGAAIMVTVTLAVGRSSRGAFVLADSLDAERAKNEELVLNMLPPAAVQRIRGGLIVADSYADTSVVFIDMVGFSSLAKKFSPGHLVELLNAFFNHADACAKAHGVEKVKTVGDAYLAIAGGNVECANSADAAIAFAKAVLEGVPEVRRVAGYDIGLRAGIHSGPVVGGVIGATRMAYDYWGDTVNIAARLEGTAPPNGMAISESTWLRARDRSIFGQPTMITLKGVGETCVYHAVIAESEEKLDLTAPSPFSPRLVVRKNT